MPSAHLLAITAPVKCVYVLPLTSSSCCNGLALVNEVIVSASEEVHERSSAGTSPRSSRNEIFQGYIMCDCRETVLIFNR